MAKKCLGEINGLANNLVPSLSRKGENYSDSGDSVNCENFDYTDSDENAERDADWCEQKVKIDKRRIDSFANGESFLSHFSSSRMTRKIKLCRSVFRHD